VTLAELMRPLAANWADQMSTLMPDALTCCHRTAIGETVEALLPWIFSGCIMKANSWTFFDASSSSFMYASR
jgi:hypothetical protein